MADFYLASASPRRAELLAQIGVRFATCPTDIDERVLAAEAPAAYVERLARAKAAVALARLPQGACVLGSDTAVVLDGQILGKPADFTEAQATLRALSGRAHEVLTAVALADATRCEVRVVATRVWFTALSDAQIARYWASGEPCDKAGAYGIQGLGAVFVSRIEGSYSAVVGLPLCETAQLLEAFGVASWNC